VLSVFIRARSTALGLDSDARVRPGPWERHLDPEGRSAGTELAKEVAISNVAGAGDVDRDGSTDVLVGDPKALDGRGVARLVSGRSGHVLYTFTGSPDWNLGQALATAGDVDRDGIVDLLIGARGRVLVCSGRDGAVIRTLVGRADGDGFGHALAPAGDVDRDGSTDTLVGAPGGSYAQVFSGRTGAVLHSFSGTSDFGHSVDGGQDTDGDGVPEILIGSPSEGVAPLFVNGRVSLFSGASGSLLWTEVGATAWESLGTSVAFLGDLNGDGKADWAAGAPEDHDPSTPMGAGNVRVYAGPGGALLRAIGGPGAPTGGFGRKVASAGDFDGDGINDLLVAADGLGYLEILSPGRHFALLRHIQIPVRGKDLASAICGNVDIDGDRTFDVLMGTAGVPGFTRLSTRSHVR
jgi:hypothetical protein